MKVAATGEDITEHVDAASGYTFYRNVSDGTVTWTDRRGSKGAKAPAANELWTEHVDPASGYKFYRDQSGTVTWTAKNTGASGAAPKWVKHIDKVSGYPFWQNLEDGTVSWTEKKK